MSICQIYFMLFISMFLMLFFLGLLFLINELVYFFEFNFYNFNSFSFEMVLYFDWITLMFLSFVLFISSMVILYSEEYMSGDLNLSRFILLVVLFVFSMMLMIVSPNLISILMGWDGLGLVSYCLVIYYQNVKSFNSGMLTVLSNRVGDVMLIIAIAWMMNFGSWNFIYYLEYFDSLKFMGILIIIAGLTKSAQIPFSSWLPAAMAAPTPVSALVHSSTLVTAGVYLLIRFNFLILEYSKMLLFISLITMFMAGLSANFENDLKKIIALSTLSQLGMMMMILSLGEYKLAFFHLLIHALFKALLFMCAGNMIHLMNNNQDIRFMGGMVNTMPLTMVYFNVSNLSLCGFPFLSGFYSKDLIIEFYSLNFNIFVYLFMYLSLGLTVSYSFRLFYYSLLGDFNFNSINCINENFNLMTYSMGSMFLMVLLTGSFLNWVIFKYPLMYYIPSFMKFLVLLFIIFGVLLGVELAKVKYLESLFSKKFFLMNNFMFMWNLPFLSTFGVNYYFLLMGGKFMKFIDQGWLEYFGPQNLFSKSLSNSLYLQSFMKNNLKIYFILMLMWILILLIFML
uniref:NADH dehydrogenase subunit 5 n=1 Tax=Chilocorus rubidus TaxID=419958 RepID=UPI00286C0D60|nr:NADH dehydrogenase subunit 5 [Chilocorus rubidus]WMB96358.1 NADH dehydrogenase subunit 5 [Chilocorus rubidus]